MYYKFVKEGVDIFVNECIYLEFIPPAVGKYYQHSPMADSIEE